jgi:hypothetical protein
MPICTVPCFRHDWQDTAALAQQVQQVKERHYQELTAGGIRAFAGAVELVARARQLGVVLGVASSGAPSKIEHNLKSSGLYQHLRQEVGSGRGRGTALHWSCSTVHSTRQWLRCAKRSSLQVLCGARHKARCASWCLGSVSWHEISGCATCQARQQVCHMMSVSVD